MDELRCVLMQGFLFRSKKDRQDEDEKIMKIADLRSIEAQEKLLREYVRAERKSRYDTDASSKVRYSTLDVYG